MPRKINEAKLFESVITLWMTHGYAGCTTKDIAQNSGVNEATLFRRYANKAGLFARAIDNQLADAPLAALSVSGDLNTDLVTLANAYIKTFEKYGDVVFRLLRELPPCPEVRESASSLLGNIQKMTQLFVHHQKNGHLRQEHPMLALAAFIGPIAAYLMFEHSGLNPDVPPFDVEAHVVGFVKGRGLVEPK